MPDTIHTHYTWLEANLGPLVELFVIQYLLFLSFVGEWLQHVLCLLARLPLISPMPTIFWSLLTGRYPPVCQFQWPG